MVWSAGGLEKNDADDIVPDLIQHTANNYPHNNSHHEADVTMGQLVHRLGGAQTCGCNVDNHVDENQPSYQKPHPYSSSPFSNVAVALDGVTITVELHVQPPEQATTVEREAAHEDVEQSPGYIAVLPESVRRIEGTQDVGCACK